MRDDGNSKGGASAGERCPGPERRANAWRFTRYERVFLGILLAALFLFGAIIERRTALRTQPMTDFGVFACAAWAAHHGGNLYDATDWHGWHYQYPPMMAILLVPFQQPVPSGIYPPPPIPRTRENTEWGYPLDAPSQFEPLGERNVRFFWLVAGWYGLSVVLLAFSLHVLACALEGVSLRSGPPAAAGERRRWWVRRLVPALVCAGSLGTDLSRGQVDILMLAAVAAGIYLYARHREWLAGLCLAFPICIKLLPVMLFWPVWKRRPRLLGGLAAGLVLGLVILPVIGFGPAGAVATYRQWVEVLAKPMLGQGADTSRHEELVRMDGTDNQSVLAWVHHLGNFGRRSGERPVDASSAERGLALAVGIGAIVVVLAVADRSGRESPRSVVLFAGLLAGVALLFSPVVHNYYFLLLMPLVAALVDRHLGSPGTRSLSWASASALMLFAGTDVITRIPLPTVDVRAIGIPLLTWVGLMAVGATALLEERREGRAGSR